MKKITKNFDKKIFFLFVVIFLINVMTSLILTSGELPSIESLFIKLVGSAYLASELPLLKKVSKEGIDPEYAIFIVFFSLVGGTFVLSFIVEMIRGIGTSPQLEKEMIYTDVFIGVVIFLVTLILLFKSILTMIRNKNKTRD